MAPIDKELQSKFQSDQQKAMLNVVFTGNWLLHRHAVFLKPYGLSPQQYNILRILRGSSSRMTMNDIKCRMLDRTPNVTRLSDKLVEKNLVDRVRCDDDRRVVYLEINAIGLNFLKDLDAKWMLTDLPERKLSDEEANQLSGLLDKLRE